MRTFYETQILNQLGFKIAIVATHHESQIKVLQPLTPFVVDTPLFDLVWGPQSSENILGQLASAPRHSMGRQLQFPYFCRITVKTVI